MSKNPYILIGLAMTIFMAGCKTHLPQEVELAYAYLPEKLNFNIDVKPILSDKCFLCHGPDANKREADLRLDLAREAYRELSESPGKVAIRPGDPDRSEVYHRIISDLPDYMMPAPESHLTLTAREKAILIKWIENGAEYKPHWAFIKPEHKDPPIVKNTAWIQNPIDHFVAKKLETEKLAPSPKAEKAVLLRRLSFDLTGLPPTETEIEAFLTDPSPEAYERQVDRLLASPHYGEKMATDWLDLARYADTHGYTVDYYRDVSPWRDWVIQAFNENMRYDRFIHWQLAGDMMPNPSTEQILATTFNRLHPQNLEDGIIDEEFRVEYVVDRTAILGTGFMGLTIGCARCHDHKYDPISQKNFYQLYSFFNNINEAGLIPRESSTPVPTLLLPDEKQKAHIQYLDSLLADKRSTLTATKKQEEAHATSWIKSAKYQSLKPEIPNRGLIAQYKLENNLRNSQHTAQLGKMDRHRSNGEKPSFTQGYNKQGLLLDGDAWLDLDKVGIFQRKDAFSIGLWVHIPESLSEGVIFHKGKGTGLHAYRGYHLYMKDDKLELMLSHTAPDNAIIKQSIEKVPKNKWLHLMLTYDGSSKASGLKVYQGGRELETETVIDNLYKDIIFFNYEDVIYKEPIEPGLQIGGRWRGVGIKGARVDDIIVYNVELSGLEVLQIADPQTLGKLTSKALDQLSPDDRSTLNKYYLAALSPAFKKHQSELKQARAVLFDSLENIKEIMVMKEMEKPRKTFILERGLYDNYGEEVFPNVPKSILPWPDSLPKNRLGLAQWLTHSDHPLTARVAVNRYWQNYFGRGLVRTTEDFGNQGELPSHPKLLDWLAITFVKSGWDVKALQKLIVMSATYRQRSLVSDKLRDTDPENILLARGPKLRLSSEMMRDNALMASGLLNLKIGGESVKPYQPEGLWRINSNTYIQDKGSSLYRRSMYTLWKRTVPNPTLATFDQPERNECTVRRQKTNTPLQALVLMNDPTYLEAAKVIGESMTKEGSTKGSIARAYRKITGLEIRTEELDLLKKLQASEYAVFNSNDKKAQGWLNAGAYKINDSLDVNMIAANAIVASVILNSDASITKR